MDDYRVKVGFFDHPKTVRLERTLGPAAVLSLLRLWDFCAQYRVDGVLSGLDNEDVAAAGRWPDDADRFVEILIKCRLLERNDSGTLIVHDWLENNPFVATKASRIAKAKAAAAARWSKTDDSTAAGSNKQSSEHAPSIVEQSPPHTHHHHTAPPSVCSDPRAIETIGDLQAAGFRRFGDFSETEKTRLRDLLPISGETWAKVVESPAQTWTYARKIIAGEKAKRRGQGPPQDRSAFRTVTEELNREFVHGQHGATGEGEVLGAHDAPSGLLPAAGQRR